MKSPESKEPGQISRANVIREMQAAIARGETFADSAVPLLGRWIAQERTTLPDTPQGAIELRRRHAHVLAEAGFPIIAIDLLDDTSARFKREIEADPAISNQLRADINEIDAMRQINEEIRAISTGWRKVLMNPEEGAS